MKAYMSIESSYNFGKKSVMTGKRFGLIAAIPVVILVAAVIYGVYNAHAQVPGASEYRIKSAFLYNFAKFVEWPGNPAPDTKDFITLCIVGQDHFGDIIETVRGKTVKGKNLVIRQCKEIMDFEDCQIIFISSSEKERVRQILEAIQNRNVLTVGEMKGFAQLGGIINFIIKKNKVRFEINVDAANRAGLKISSKLLKLAKIVGNEHQGGEGIACENSETFP